MSVNMNDYVFIYENGGKQRDKRTCNTLPVVGQRENVNRNEKQKWFVIYINTYACIYIHINICTYKNQLTCVEKCPFPFVLIIDRKVTLLRKIAISSHSNSYRIQFIIVFCVCVFFYWVKAIKPLHINISTVTNEIYWIKLCYLQAPPLHIDSEIERNSFE